MNTTSNKTKKAVVYCRVSTNEQADNGLSIQVQEKVCEETIKKDGLELFKTIKDEGYSGGSLKRPGIQELLGLVKEKKIDAVYTIHGDRLARNTIDYLTMRELFRKNSITLKYIYQPITDDTAASRTMDTVMASFNEMQRLVISEKVKATLNEKARSGYFPSVPPLGYINVPNPDKNTDRLARKIIKLHQEIAPLITEAFKLYATGNFNGYDLNDLMYKKGLRTRNNIKLSPSRFYELLKNRIYLGEVHWGEVHVKGKHEPLIDEDTFNAVQSIMAGHNQHACRRRKYSWLLNGFVYCWEHKKRYTAEWHLDKKLAYYHCTNRYGCGKYVEKNKLEEEVAEKFKEIEFNDSFVEMIINKAKEIFYKRRREYEAKKQALVNKKTALELKYKVAQDKLFTGVLFDEDFKIVKNEIKSELNTIEEEIFELESKQEVQVDIAQEILAFTRNIYKTYLQASHTLKRHYLGFFWEKFYVTDGVIIKSVPTLLFRELLKLQQVVLKTKNPQVIRDSGIFDGVIINNIRLRR